VLTPSSPLSVREFGRLPDGTEVQAWTLVNNLGLLLEVITYGGIVTRLLAPDREGLVADVVLGFNTLDAYLAGHPYFGAIVGRVAGRITGGQFTLGDRAYQLALNDPPNHLHGGRVGFDKRVWSAESPPRAKGSTSLRLSLRSPDGEEGYSGNVEASVTYTLTDRNEFIFETAVTTDQPTPISLTHHSYFNLFGEGSGSVADHQVQIYADDYAPTDTAMTLLGQRAAVDDAGNDFRQPRRLADALPHLLGAHGDLYFVRRAGSDPRELVPAARIVDPQSGRVLEVRTTEQCLQFYTGVSLDGSLHGKSGRPYKRHSGFCLEAEGYPDGINRPALGNIVLPAGETRRHITVYSFSHDQTGIMQSKARS
jgi:aldose 1-epimerase